MCMSVVVLIRDYRVHHIDGDSQEEQSSADTIHQRELYNLVITKITQTCRIVNQVLCIVSMVGDI